jgi:hypothetical protein
MTPGKVDIVIEEFRRVRRGSLVGFVTLRVRQWFLRVHGVSIHELKGSRWASMPARPQISRAGELIKAEGKIQYSPVIKISSPEARAAFSAAVIRAARIRSIRFRRDQGGRGMSEPASPVTELRLRLRRAGYAPLPVAGKEPIVKEWETKTEVTEHEITNWEFTHPACTNTGALTRLMPALDIDIMNEAAAIAVEALARDWFEERGYFLTRTGRAPKRAIPLRTDKPFPIVKRLLTAPNGDPKKPERIEILGDGQQLVLAGIHPDTGQPYTWQGGEPGAIPLEELPYIDESTASRFADAAATLLIAEHGYRIADKAGAKTNGAGAEDEAARVDWSKFSNLLDHDNLVSIAMSLLKAGMHQGGVYNLLRTQIEVIETPDIDRKQRRLDELRDIVSSAEKKSGAAAAAATAPASLGELDAGDDHGPIPPRPWLLATQFCRKFLSSVVAPGNTGKSALRYLQALALATGRPLTGQRIFHRCRVLLVTLEDDLDEMRRRIKAAIIHHQIDRQELKGWLFYAAPKGLKLAEMRDRSRQAGALEKALRDAIARRKPELLMLDPFVKLHALEENDNAAMDYVCDLLTQLAIEFDIAVDAPHHTHKGMLTAGDADNGRGASGIRDAGRLVYTLVRMNSEEAAAFAVPEAERQAYVRIDSAKANLVPPATAATWFKLVNVRLENGTAEYPNGDEVQTVIPWSPPDTWANLSTDTLNSALSEIDTGMGNGQRYSDANAARERAAWQVVNRHCPDRTEAQCKEIVKTWVKNGVLCREEYDDPVKREPRLGLRLDPSKRPGTTTVHTAARKTRFRKIDDCPVGTVCACCHLAEGKVARWVNAAMPGSKSEPLHESCCANFWPSNA